MKRLTTIIMLIALVLIPSIVNATEYTIYHIEQRNYTHSNQMIFDDSNYTVYSPSIVMEDYIRPEGSGMFWVLHEDGDGTITSFKSDLPFNPSAPNWKLSPELGEYISYNILKNRDNDSFSYISSSYQRQVNFCYNQYNNCLMNRCQNYQGMYVIKYTGTIDRRIPYLWRFSRSGGLRPTSVSASHVESNFDAEYPYRCDTWDLYWDYLTTNNSRPLYDPASYHDEWTYIYYFEYTYANDNPDNTYIIYMSSEEPESVADLYTISTPCRFNTNQQ